MTFYVFLSCCTRFIEHCLRPLHGKQTGEPTKVVGEETASSAQRLSIMYASIDAGGPAWSQLKAWSDSISAASTKQVSDSRFASRSIVCVVAFQKIADDDKPYRRACVVV